MEETVLSPQTGGKSGHCKCEQLSNMMLSQRAFILSHVLTLDAKPWI